MDGEQITKVCFKCNIEKPLAEFYVHKMMADRHLNKCKDCTKKDVHEHRKNNIEKIRQYDRDRTRLQHRIRMREEYYKKYSVSEPDKVRAVNLANNAIRDKKIAKKPCEVCGATERIEKHHTDYSKPLEVVFLCSKHHKKAHGFGLDYD